MAKDHKVIVLGGEFPELMDKDEYISMVEEYATLTDDPREAAIRNEVVENLRSEIL